MISSMIASGLGSTSPWSQMACGGRRSDSESRALRLGPDVLRLGRDRSSVSLVWHAEVVAPCQAGELTQGWATSVSELADHPLDEYEYLGLLQYRDAIHTVVELPAHSVHTGPKVVWSGRESLIADHERSPPAPSDGRCGLGMEHSVSVIDPALLSDGLVCWTGYGRTSWPHRDDDALVERFGEDVALDLLRVVKALEHEFYESDARLYSADLSEIGSQAASEFRQSHPELSEDAVQALAWCYTFDFK